MRVNGYELNELYHFSVIDVNFLKQNIFAVILLQSSEARIFQRSLDTTAWAETPHGGHSSSNQYLKDSYVSNSKEL